MSQQAFYETVQREQEYKETIMEENKFKELFELNVNHKTEQKDGLTYLSWAWAWAEFKKVYPNAHYQIGKTVDGLPYFESTAGAMCYTSVTAGGITHEMWLPVMNGANKAMKSEPYTYQTKYGEKQVEAFTMFDVNKTLMRCLVKNLAMFGLGLYIYSGEDIPEVEVDASELVKKITDTKSLAELQSAFKAALNACGNDNNAKAAVIKAKDEMKSLFEGGAK